MKNKRREITALTRIYDLILWIIPILEKFPRAQKFLLGDRIETLLLDIMDLIIEATYSKQKAPILKEANLKIEKARYLVRLVKDMRYLSTKRYGYIANCLNTIGAEIGGWLKYSESRQYKNNKNK